MRSIDYETCRYCKKTHRNTFDASDRDTSYGSNGVAISPPDYGIELVDRQTGEVSPDYERELQSPEPVALSVQFAKLAENQSMSPRNDGGVIQRALDFNDIMDSTIFTRAIGIYHGIEQEDLSKEEFDILKTERQRFMPLLGRFSLARGATLRVRKRPKRVVGDMALTRLFCITNSGAKYEFDTDRDAFIESAGNREIREFEVEIGIWDRRLIGEDKPGTLRSVGTLLQAFTHEMTVHAENMLDYIEDYWDYFDGGKKFPKDLGSASEEHTSFKEGEVKRYEYMKARMTKQDGSISKDFSRRDITDKWSAK